VRELQFAASQLCLNTFGTINHKQFLTDVDHLRGTKMMRSRQSRSASQYSYFKFLQNKLS
jgi:hypothetical protein